MKQVEKNNQLQELIVELHTLSSKENVPLWKRVAKDLSKPTRERRLVNIYKIQAHSKEDETVVVPGKVLGVGELNRKVNVAALTFSDQAYEKIKKMGNAISIQELMKQNPKGKKVRILG